MNRWRRSLLLLLLLALLAAAGCAGKSKAQEAVLAIEGSGVETPVEVTLEELQAMTGDLVEDDYFSINTYGTEEYFHFKGVWVWAVLEKKASLKGEATKASFVAEDGYTATYTLEEVRRDDYMDQQDPGKKYKMILAWEENHQPYDISEGSPFRLVIGQKEPGDVNKPYWVRQVVKIVVE
ncbi:MAG TPA: molybdopterin-dependent oxidoreductase [Bacillota bacterium]|jgi:hypothetical protein|nr:molybdopterin-dependent oxidoreductase [Bacillota bacterium]HOJ83601.1 molybdopterin-dependent oxidoreductase [Bacillota bacterium]HOL15212.1 molybdopterin-dependent oxidoreductase [Bacillota bacterium]HPZ12437.1 molybdopterin-dependent oxidoreductase [Bacillota bacterium]HQE10799.1 molybdopterin-dependent oxidoreductase [Bacillota bacterium]